LERKVLIGDILISQGLVSQEEVEGRSNGSARKAAFSASI